jgi:hypothetical protein
MEGRVLDFIHLVDVKSYFLADALDVLIIEINAITEALDCSLES